MSLKTCKEPQTKAMNERREPIRMIKEKLGFRKTPTTIMGTINGAIKGESSSVSKILELHARCNRLQTEVLNAEWNALQAQVDELGHFKKMRVHDMVQAMVPWEVIHSQNQLAFDKKISAAMADLNAYVFSQYTAPETGAADDLIRDSPTLVKEEAVQAEKLPLKMLVNRRDGNLSETDEEEESYDNIASLSTQKSTKQMAQGGNTTCTPSRNTLRLPYTSTSQDNASRTKSVGVGCLLSNKETVTTLPKVSPKLFTKPEPFRLSCQRTDILNRHQHKDALPSTLKLRTAKKKLLYSQDQSSNNSFKVLKNTPKRLVIAN